MARSSVVRLKTCFVCQNCGAVASRWQGKCDDCGEWNTLVEENAGGGVGAEPGGAQARQGARRWR